VVGNFLSKERRYEMVLNLDDRTTVGQRVETRSKSTDPAYQRANEVLAQIDRLRIEKSTLCKQADQLQQRIDSLETTFHRLVLDLEPTVREDKTLPRVVDPMKRLSQAIRERLADRPNLHERLEKILSELTRESARKETQNGQDN